MADDLARYLYQPSDRAEVFELLRASLAPDVSARLIAQWVWRFETSPVDPPQPPVIDLIRSGAKLIAMSAGFRVRMWMGGLECLGAARGLLMVHPDHRGDKLWQRLGIVQATDTPAIFGWSTLPGRVLGALGWHREPLTPMVRILAAGPLVEWLTHSPVLGSIGAALNSAARAASAPLRARGSRSGAVVRLKSFDDRADALWKRARRATKAMVVRDQHYLNWRYCERPDASYSLYGVERASELAGFLVARTDTLRGMPWGCLTDFLAPEDSGGVLSSLVVAALDDFRRAGIVAVSCFATDAAARRALFRRGFFPVPWRQPVDFICRFQAERTDLAKFAPLREWYLTMGDGDFDMLF